MKRLLIFTALLLLTTTGYSQQPGLATSQQTGITYFGQCMLNLSSADEYAVLENSLRENPNISIVRLDNVSQRAFIISKEIPSLTIEQFRSWFGEFSDRVSCIQVGVHQIDEIAHYPFTNCQN